MLYYYYYLKSLQPLETINTQEWEYTNLPISRAIKDFVLVEQSRPV